METWFWVLACFLSILTMVGNGFVIFLVCRRRQLRTKTNTFIVSLAVADFCVGLIAVLSPFVCNLANCNPPNIEGLLVLYIRIFIVYASGSNLLSLVLERYIAVVKPLKYLTFVTRRRVTQMVVISWVIPLVVIVIAVSIERILNAEEIPFHVTLLINSLSFMSFEVILSIVFLFCVLSTLLVVYNNRQGRSVVKRLQHNVLNQRIKIKTQSNSAIKMMIIVTSVFLLCYGLLLRCSISVLHDNNDCNDFHYKMPLQVVNSGINPLAYALFKRDIKAELKRVFKKRQ